MNTRGLVEEFHRAFGVAIAQPVSAHLLALRARLIREEGNEAINAIEGGSLWDMAQELADLVYVAYGTAVSLGIDLDIAITEVHRANMSKLGAEGRPLLRHDGKVMKGPGYRPPDMSAAVQGLRGLAPWSSLT